MKRIDHTNNAFFLLLRLGCALSFLAVGLYYEAASAVAFVYFTALLLWLGRKQKLVWRCNDALLAAVCIPLCYLLSCLWAVDRGIAVWGVVKFLPLAPFALCSYQITPKERIRVLEDIPWIGAVMTVVSFTLQYIPAFTDSFSVAGRLAGLFQYPNTFACFLLLGLELLLLGKDTVQPFWLRTICGTILLFGVLQAGSRTIHVFVVPALTVCLIVRKGKPALYLTLGTVIGGTLLSVLASLLGSSTGVDRVLEISTGASTFLGRLLYWKDALPVIAKHPLGLGYLGYYITQGSFQTGVYSVRWVHNDFLQLLLDVGWIPALLAVIAVVRALFSKRLDALRRIVLLTLLAHCMMDFDLEFVSMYFVVLLCLDWEDLKQRSFRLAALPAAIAVILALGSVYIGVVSTLTYGENHTLASVLYPWNTFSNMSLLTQLDNPDELEALADRILEQDDQIALAWDAKARAAYSRGDFATVITAKRQAISLAKYSIEEYADYFEMLASGVELYRAAGDTESAAYCLQEIRSIQTLLDGVAAQTDPLAWRLADTPQLELPAAYTQYLKAVDNVG